MFKEPSICGAGRDYETENEKKLIIEAKLEEAKKKEIISEGFEKVQIHGGDENTELYVVRVSCPYISKDREGNEKISYMDQAYAGLNKEQAHRYFTNQALTRSANWAVVNGDIETGEIEPLMTFKDLQEEQENFERGKKDQEEKDRKQSSAGARFVQ